MSHISKPPSNHASSTSSRASSARKEYLVKKGLLPDQNSNSLSSLLSETHKQQRHERESNHSGDNDQFEVFNVVKNSQKDNNIGRWAEQVSAETMSSQEGGSSRQSLPPFPLEISGSQERGNNEKNYQNLEHSAIDRPRESRSSTSSRHRSKERKEKSRSTSLNLMNSIENTGQPQSRSLIRNLVNTEITRMVFNS
jgi:hypothetical protein